MMDNGHHHGGPPITLNKNDKHIFEVRDLRLFKGEMKGYWEIRVDLVEEQEVLDRVAQKVVYCPLDFKEQDICAEIKWLEGPKLNEKSKFSVTFWRKDDHNLSAIDPGFDVKIYSWMMMDNGHHHGGPKMTAEKKSVGVWQVDDARFFMGGMKGHWLIRVDLIQEAELVERAFEKVTFKESE